MTEKFHDYCLDQPIPDRGRYHALIIGLFDAKKVGKVASKDALCRAIGKETGRHITEFNLRVMVKNLREDLATFGYEISTTRGFGYSVKSPSAIEQKKAQIDAKIRQEK